MPGRPPTSGAARRSVCSAAAAIGGLVAVVASFLPWARSGRRRRSSYQLVAVAQRLGVADGSWSRLARLWVLLPAIVAAGLALAITGRHRAAAGLLTVAGVGTLAVAWLVIRSPLPTEHGLPLAAAGAIISLASAPLAVSWRNR